SRTRLGYCRHGVEPARRHGWGRRWPAGTSRGIPGDFSPDVSLLNTWEVEGKGALRDLGRAPSDQSAGIAGPAVADTARDGGRMAAPTGVNEELPGEPAKAGRAGAELSEPRAAGAETSEPETSGTETSETGTAETKTAETETSDT